MPNPTNDQPRQDEKPDPSNPKPRYEPPELIRLTDLSVAKGGVICTTGGQGFPPAR